MGEGRLQPRTGFKKSFPPYRDVLCPRRHVVARHFALSCPQLRQIHFCRLQYKIPTDWSMKKIILIGARCGDFRCTTAPHNCTLWFTKLKKEYR